MCEPIWMSTYHVEFYLGEQVMSFKEEPAGVTVCLKSGREVTADFVVLSIGVKPERRLAREAGLALGAGGGIAVNEYLQTADSDIYAVGDAIETPDAITGTRRHVPLAGPANKQGRIAADNIVFNNRETYHGTAGTAIAKVFDITAAVTGFSEKLLQQKNMPFQSVLIHSVSHAGYYPGAMPMALKLLFTPDGRIYGAQAVGYDGVDKAMEILSALCQNGLGVRQLCALDQAYAPPYSSAKSPVNMIGFVAENVLNGVVKVKSWQDVQTRGENVFLLDVRTETEVRIGAIPGSYHIPIDQLRGRIAEVPRDKAVYIYCASGMRSYLAARILTQHGYADVANVSGGYRTWETATMHQGNEDIYDKYRVAKDDRLYLKDRRRTDRSTPPGAPLEIDARGLQCPGPIMRLNDRMRELAPGATVRVRATDPGFASDVKAWCDVTGNKLLALNQDVRDLSAVIEKGAAPAAAAGPAGNNKTIIVFDDDFDRALAAFVIANGALAMGRKVTMFFTFWGLNVLKKSAHPPVHKDVVSRMFALMLPRGADALKLSRLNMFGLGSRLMRSIMKRKNIDSLRQLMDAALAGGAVIIACQMSMDIMGVAREELIDGIQYGGVATYIEATESASTNLFI
jgi:peroxiredoxin family protein/rhodanese-related sulfurtransferase/TusA-related sulfurtransferase